MLYSCVGHDYINMNARGGGGGHSLAYECFYRDSTQNDHSAQKYAMNKLLHHLIYGLSKTHIVFTDMHMMGTL